jgi:hypothetical protein
MAGRVASLRRWNVPPGTGIGAQQLSGLAPQFAPAAFRQLGYESHAPFVHVSGQAVRFHVPFSHEAAVVELSHATWPDEHVGGSDPPSGGVGTTLRGPPSGKLPLLDDDAEGSPTE